MFVLNGIQLGFRVGFNYSQQVLKSKSRNKLSTLDHPAVVKANIHNKLTLGRLVYIQNFPGFMPVQLASSKKA